MPDVITLESCTFTEARLRRLGGHLTYGNELVPPDTEVIMTKAAANVANLVLNDGRLVSVLAHEITVETFEYGGEVTALDAFRATLYALRQEIIAGEPLQVQPGTVIRRTGRPFAVSHEHYAPHDTELVVDQIARHEVRYSPLDPAGGRGRFYSRYFTDAYFEVVRLTSWAALPLR